LGYIFIGGLPILLVWRSWAVLEIIQRHRQLVDGHHLVEKISSLRIFPLLELLVGWLDLDFVYMYLNHKLFPLIVENLRKFSYFLPMENYPVAHYNVVEINDNVLLYHFDFLGDPPWRLEIVKIFFGRLVPVLNLLAFVVDRRLEIFRPKLPYIKGLAICIFVGVTFEFFVPEANYL
jgi:hypothetical protein